MLFGKLEQEKKERTVDTFDINYESYYEIGVKSLRTFALILRKRMERDWDNVIAITGEEGVGKSTAAIVLAKLVDKKFKIKKNEIVSTDTKTLVKKITKLPPKSVIVVDEAIKLLYKQEWATKSQRFLNIIYALARKERKTTILCIPRFKDLNEYFRNHRVKFWIHLLTRGFGVLFARDWSPFNDDPWWLKESQKLLERFMIGKKLSEITIETKSTILKNCKTFVTFLVFPDLDEKTKEEYKQFIAEHKYEGLIEEEKETKSKKEQELKERLKKAILHLFFEKKYHMSRIAELLGTSHHYIREVVKSDPRYEELKKKEKEKKEKKNSFLELLRRKGIA